MAEALALCASIVAVIQIADRVAELCKAYIGGVTNYPKDLRVILIETSSLKILLENLTFLGENDGNASSILASLDGNNGPIEGCRKTTSELEKLFPPEQLQSDKEGGRRKKVRLSLAALAWPFRAEKARALLGQLAQHIDVHQLGDIRRIAVSRHVDSDVEQLS